MTYESINTNRTCQTSQRCDRYFARNERIYRRSRDARPTLCNISSACISIYQNCPKARRQTRGSRSQESFYTQIAYRTHRTDPAKGAANRKEHQRYCCRSDKVFFGKKVKPWLWAIRRSMNMKWCLSLNSTVFMHVNLHRYTSC